MFFAQAIINTQFQTNVYIETKYIAQCCSESLMDTSTEVRRSFFYFYGHSLYSLIIINESEATDQNIYRISIYQFTFLLIE